MSNPSTLFNLPLPVAISERQIQSDSGDLSFHILEAGVDDSYKRPLLLLLHGFPEIAYSWRKLMPPLASAGYYVVAVDHRGFGRTTGWDTRPFKEADLRSFSITNIIRDVIVLVHALGYERVRCIISHDMGAVLGAASALARPDLFEGLILMSHPFKGSPVLPFDTKHPSTGFKVENTAGLPNIHEELAKLQEPRKLYKWYYSTEPANSDMLNPPEGLHKFLRGYFHLKSADWTGNDPHTLKTWNAYELSKLPYYYTMPLGDSMREAIERDMENENIEEVKKKGSRWLTDEELDVYVKEYQRTGFQGGLNWYRVQTDPHNRRDFDMFAGKKLEVPTLYIAGTKDWGKRPSTALSTTKIVTEGYTLGSFQEPGALEKMPRFCTDFRGSKFIDNAGHWVAQEQPEEVLKEVLGFLKTLHPGERL
ncbi:MAG: hypothetical protein M1834_009090 [Cirrosporium novae-zelandiae]|nr:MAG: hypothetical protein M1834_009090 [Cirrosporium novae-zelandiae]